MSDLRKRPWNRVDQPVYSVASAWNDKANMNICTYAVPVSMKPKMYVVALYHNTCTLELVKANPEFLLQLLDRRHYGLVNLLGKTSGYKTDKLKKIKIPIEWHANLPYLSDALGFIHLKAERLIETGDHMSAICRVKGYRNLNNGKPLTLTYLRYKKIISA